MDKLTLATIKQQNLSSIYKYIFDNENCSKTTIANALNISMPTVSQHLKTLLEDGLIEKSGQLSSSIGRKATAYSIVSTARISIGVELIEKRITIAAVDLTGSLIVYERANIPFRDDDTYYREICEAILSFIRRHNYEKEQILGVGFSVQGLVSSDYRNMTWVKILPLDGLSADYLEGLLGLPVLLCHDAEAAAQNTLWHKPELTNLIFLSLSAHLGGALIIDGEIRTGSLGRNGLIEHMILYPKGKKCYCGQSGCAECYCSGSVLLEGEELEFFFEHLRNGLPSYVTRWEHYLQELSLLLNNLHMVFGEPILLGGHMSSFLENRDFDYLNQCINSITTFRDSESFVLPGSRMNHEIAIGSALIFIRRFLSEI